ncbi:HAMP domain-containing sensor histidine kinase [Nakamurella sp. A5-74]|uniref:histidine kinase n=1 Tax=Nakamurella sp. A5-74 TaxID=3158264 RepID=A0AAU8DJH7_9ACTN
MSVRTPAVRARLVIGVVAILAITLVSAGWVVGAVYTRQTDDAASALLTSRLQLARQLALQGTAPRQLVNRVDAQGVRATLTLPSGEQLGAAPVSGPRREAVLAGTGQVRGARLVLTIDSALVDQAGSTLARTLVLTGLAALLLGALLAVLLATSVLYPLRRMAQSARRIAGGERGVRLDPTPATSELGQTATALDSMLDSLEGAEQEAVQTRIRGEQFLADVAHELRTPMTGVRLAAESLLHQQLRPDERDELLAQIVGEVQRSSQLLDQLLALARSEPGAAQRREPLSLYGMAADQMRVLQQIHPRVRFALQPELAIGSAADPTIVVAEPTALRGMVRNLLDNAVRASADAQQPWVECRWSAADGTVALDVADAGAGVPEAERELIFARMYRGDGDRSRSAATGSGLGLSLARRFARVHGGDVLLWDTRPPGLPQGAGAVFRLVLPATATSEVPPTPPLSA